MITPGPAAPRHEMTSPDKVVTAIAVAAGSTTAAVLALTLWPASWPAWISITLGVLYSTAAAVAAIAPWFLTQAPADLRWRRGGGWHGRVGRSSVWAYPTPWGALHGAWRLHQHDTGRRYLSGQRPRS